MPKPIAMTLDGSSSGKISDGACSPESIGGLSRGGDRADTCLVLAYRDGVIRPTDPQVGRPTGNRVHEGLTVTKVIDKTSPILRQAIAPGTSETFTVELLFYWAGSDGGVEELYYKVILEEATIVGIRGHTPNVLDPDNANYVDMEDVSFTYKKVSYEHVVASGQSVDDTAES